MNTLNQKAFQVVWADLVWRKELATERRPIMLTAYAEKVLRSNGFREFDKNSDLRCVSMFELYAEGMKRLNEQREEESNSGAGFCDGLFVIEPKSFDADFEQLQTALDRMAE